MSDKIIKKRVGAKIISSRFDVRETYERGSGMVQQDVVDNYETNGETKTKHRNGSKMK